MRCVTCGMCVGCGVWGLPISVPVLRTSETTEVQESLNRCHRVANPGRLVQHAVDSLFRVSACRKKVLCHVHRGSE